jgi:hypothetical protein
VPWNIRTVALLILDELNIALRYDYLDLAAVAAPSAEAKGRCGPGPTVPIRAVPRGVSVHFRYNRDLQSAHVRLGYGFVERIAGTAYSDTSGS